MVRPMFSPFSFSESSLHSSHSGSVLPPFRLICSIQFLAFSCRSLQQPPPPIAIALCVCVSLAQTLQSSLPVDRESRHSGNVWEASLMRSDKN
mmetsp:Transcript_32383/g.64995  ORF Transcript_32383/g.64995 Transcript_32383/m.64995 type:complete len:93 (+) Transcript_32383:126-404(+)